MPPAVAFAASEVVAHISHGFQGARDDCSPVRLLSSPDSQTLCGHVAVRAHNLHADTTAPDAVTSPKLSCTSDEALSMSGFSSLDSQPHDLDAAEVQRWLRYFEGLPNPLNDGDRLRKHPGTLERLVSILQQHAQQTFVLGDDGPGFDAQLSQKTDAARAAAFLHNAKLLPHANVVGFVSALLSHDDTLYPNLLALSEFVDGVLVYFAEHTLLEVSKTLRKTCAVHAAHGYLSPFVHDMLKRLMCRLDEQLRANNAPVLQRTVRVSGIDTQAPERDLLALLRQCGHVVKLRLCGRRTDETVFGFFQFKTADGAALMMAKGQGFQLGSRQLRVEMATSSIKDSRQAGVHRMRGDASIGQTVLPIASK